MQAAGRSGLRSARSSGRPAGTMQKEPLHMRQPQQPAPAAERAAGGHGTRPAPSTPGRRRRAPEMPGLPGWWPGEAAAAAPASSRRPRPTRPPVPWPRETNGPALPQPGPSAKEAGKKSAFPPGLLVDESRHRSVYGHLAAVQG